VTTSPPAASHRVLHSFPTRRSSDLLLLGGALALSSTAVVARLIADRRQQNCPVGQTATAILIFQDVAGILLLVVASALGGGAARSEEHTSELQSRESLGCRLLLGKN